MSKSVFQLLKHEQLGKDQVNKHDIIFFRTQYDYDDN